jgi:hypothetical protein
MVVMFSPETVLAEVAFHARHGLAKRLDVAVELVTWRWEVRDGQLHPSVRVARPKAVPEEAWEARMRGATWDSNVRAEMARATGEVVTRFGAFRGASR